MFASIIPAMKLRGNIPNYIVKWKLSCSVSRRRKRIPIRNTMPWFTSRIASTTPSLLRFIIFNASSYICHITRFERFDLHMRRRLTTNSHFFTFLTFNFLLRSVQIFIFFLYSHRINLSKHTPPHSSHAINLAFILVWKWKYSKTIHCRLSSAYWNWLTYLARSYSTKSLIFFLIPCNLRSTNRRKSSQRWLIRWKAFKCAEKVNMKGAESSVEGNSIVEWKWRMEKSKLREKKKLFIFIYRLSVELERSDFELRMHE